MRAFQETLNKLKDAFAEYLKVHRYSPCTLKSYLEALVFFDRFLEEHHPEVEQITQVSKQIIEKYQNHLYYEKKNSGDLPLGIGSQRNRLVAARSFFKFLHKEGYILYDPAGGLEFPRTKGRTLPKDIMSKPEVLKILSQPDLGIPSGMRDRAIMELLYSTGMRRSELLSLNLYDLNLEEGIVRIREAKYGRERVVPMGQAACEAIEHYIKKGRPQVFIDPEEKALFLSKYGRRLSEGRLCGLVKGYAGKARLRKKITTHSFRHTCATHLLKGKADLRAIQEILGHRCLSTTQLYTRVELSDLKRVHRLCHPREKEDLDA